MTKQTYIRFENHRTDDMTPDIGPFTFVQITYGALQLGPDGERTIAWMDVGQAAEWIIEPGFANEHDISTGTLWSDVIVFGHNDDDGE